MVGTGENKAYRSLIWQALGLGTLAAASIGLTISGLRDDAFRQATHEQNDLAIVLNQEISGTNRIIERALDRAEAAVRLEAPRDEAEFRERLSTREIGNTLAALARSAEDVGVVSLIAANGDLIATSRSDVARNLNLSHAVDYVYLSEHDTPGTYVTDPQASRAEDGRLIFFARRLNGPNGEFLGVVDAGVRLSYYEAIYSGIADLRDKHMRLRRSDGGLLASYPEDPSPRNVRIGFDPEWRRIVAAGGGALHCADCVAGQAGLVVASPLKTYPMVVEVAETDAAILAPWRVRAAEIGLGGLLALLCAGLLARAVGGQLRRSALSKASLTERGRELQSLNARFENLIENMPHGVAMYSRDRRLIIANRRYGEMYHLSAAEVRPGVRVEDILARRVEKGIYTKDGPTYIRDRLAEIQSAAAQQSIDRLSNGRVVFISRRPLGDGAWLAVHEDITARQLAEDRIEHMALHDQLTAAGNRRLLLQEMRARLAAEAPVAVLLVDLDEFKAVNDTYGHPFGDALLKAVAQRLIETTWLRGMVARIGGDEFAVLQSVEADAAGAEKLAQDLLEAIRQPFDIDGVSLAIRPSVGVALAPRDGDDAETLMRNADLALYSAKFEGRDRIGYFEPRLERAIREERAIKAELNDAVALGQFELHYQPIVDTATQRVVELEALVRWRHPVRGMIRPDYFISIAERSGLIQPIGEFVLRTACRDAAALPGSIGVAVNVSPAQFSRGNLVALVQDALMQSGLAPERLTLEITETALMENLEQSQGVLKAIRDLGVQISLDDFGSGYSSLSYLQTFALDTVKIDRSFVAEMETNSRTRDIVALIAAISRRLGALTVAEGIETKLQLDLVAAAGCEAAQGYFFSQPKPLAELDLDPMRTQRAA